MNLSRYIGAARGNATRLSAALGVSPSFLSQMASGYRSVPAPLCPRIELATAGVVRCEELRPDIPWAILREQAAVAVEREAA